MTLARSIVSRMRTIFLALAAVLAAAPAGASFDSAQLGPSDSRGPQPADLLLVNGRVYTLDPARPWAEAVAIDGDRIAAVGTTAEINTRRGP